MTSDNRPIVIASTRSWNRALVKSVGERTAREVVWIEKRNDLTAEGLQELEPEFVFLPHWSYIVPREIFEKYECVIFHMTDVPFGRGGSPLQNLVSRGIQETKMSALRCVSELDAGPVYAKRPLSLLGSAEEIFLRARDVIETMIVEIVETRPEPEPQRGTPTVFARRRPQDGDIAGLASLDQVFDWIRMLDADGYPPAFLEAGGFRLEFSRAARRQDSVLADVRILLREVGTDDDAP